MRSLGCPFHFKNRYDGCGTVSMKLYAQGFCYAAILKKKKHLGNKIRQKKIKHFHKETGHFYLISART